MKYLSIIIIALSIISGDCFAVAEQVVFATGEWPPYSSKDLPEYGAATALVSAACKAAGIQPVYEFYPWKRAELMVEKGLVFAAFPYVINEERAKTFDFSDVLFRGHAVFLYSEHNPRTRSLPSFEKLEDLRDYRIGGLSGSWWETDLKKAGLIYHVVTTIDQSIRQLELGRIDFCIGSEAVFHDTIQRVLPNHAHHFGRLSQSFWPEDANAVLVSRTYPGARELLGRFNKGLAVIKQNGEYSRLLKRYERLGNGCRLFDKQEDFNL